LKTRTILLLSLATICVLNAAPTEIKKTNNSSTFNQVDDSYSDEDGFAFYQDDKNVKTIKKQNKKDTCSCTKIMEKLSSIEKEEKRQTEIQEEILKLISQEINPKEEIITVNGKRCIKNSSADCYKMVINGKMEEIPAFVKWMDKPSMQNTANYLQWQAEHLKEIFKRGDSFPLAMAQFGEKAYPMSYRGEGHRNILGYNNYDKMIKNLILSLKADYKFLIFFGFNKDLDIMNTDKTLSLLEEYGDLDFTIIFKDKLSQTLFNDTLKSIFSKKMQDIVFSEKHVIDEKAFKKYQIFTTPSIVIVDTKEKRSQTLSNGNIRQKVFEKTIKNYLEYHNKLDYSKLNTYKNWDARTNRKSDYFKNKYGISIDKITKGREK